MLLVRRFEESLGDLFSRNLLGGTSHFCIGQEACAVGVVGAVRETDWLVSNHRGHGHLLARGLDPFRVMAELMGREAGYCGGRGGSQHMCAMDLCFLGTNGITGGGIPIGTGAAWALKYQGKDDIAVVFFGDGAGNQGTFHESLNMASLWKLPVLFVCENNGYGMSNPTASSTAVPMVSDRAAAYSMPGAVADGMNVVSVIEAAAGMAERVRSGEGPALLELTTYRFCGHSKNDPRVYRTREEETAWSERDCLAVAARELRERGLPDAEIERLYDEAAAEMDDVVERALAAPVGSREHALGGVYA
jgi:TPP-dependent pyruvate/acetoin dehydrogenase alpha subunit